MSHGKALGDLLHGEAASVVGETYLRNLVVGELSAGIALPMLVAQAFAMSVLDVFSAGAAQQIFRTVIVLEAVVVVDLVAGRNVALDVLPNEPVRSTMDARSVNNRTHLKIAVRKPMFDTSALAGDEMTAASLQPTTYSDAPNPSGTINLPLAVTDEIDQHAFV